MISVIIPALNEAKTIGNVVNFAFKHPNVSEVIVVDDNSSDGTPEIAAACGAKVITSGILGKGASMADGLRVARSSVVLYLDGDLYGLEDDLIDTLTEPIFYGWADFVKGAFSRRAGRVTILTAKPLLSIFFPEIAEFEQPLGGIVAARRSLLKKLKFENDYGVDIGLLIDVFQLKAKITETFIGYVEHDSQSLEALGNMAKQITRTILDRAVRYGRLHNLNLHGVTRVHRKSSEMAFSTY